MPSSNTVKIVIKLKDKYYLEDDIQESFNKSKSRLIVNSTIFDKDNINIVRNLYGKEEAKNNREVVSNLLEVLSELYAEFEENFVLQSLFSEINTKKVINLILTAKTRGDYLGENLLNCFFIETNEDKVDEILERIKTINNSSIHYAYIRGELVEPTSEPNVLKKSINDEVIYAINRMFDHFKVIDINDDGKNTVKIVDVEQGWCFENEGIRNLKLSKKRILGGGFNHPDPTKVAHGTKTLNVLFGEENPENNSTLNGLCSSINAHVASVWFKSGENIIENREAALASLFGIEVDKNGNLLKNVDTIIDKGDIVLLELQTKIRGIPNFLPVEVEPVMFNIIKLGVKAGFIIIEAAGNGNYNLDEPICDKLKIPKCGFKNLVDKNSGTGAIMVGALIKTKDGLDMYPNTNSGDRVDCYCFGDDISTLTQLTFNATSLATSIVAALATNLQRKEKLSGRTLNIEQMRNKLSSAPKKIPGMDSPLINLSTKNTLKMENEKTSNQTGLSVDDKEKLSHQGIRESVPVSVNSMKRTFKEEFIDKLPGSEDSSTQSGLTISGYFIGRVLLERILAQDTNATGIVFSFGLNKTIADGGELQLIAELASGDKTIEKPTIIQGAKKYATGAPGEDGPGDGGIPAIKPTP